MKELKSFVNYTIDDESILEVFIIKSDYNQLDNKKRKKVLKELLKWIRIEVLKLN